MRAHAMQTGQVSEAQIGWVLTHDISAGDGRKLLSKGTVFDAATLESWSAVAPGDVHLLQLESGDLHENAAGVRIAGAVSGAGLRSSGPITSRYDLISEAKGLLRVDRDLLRAVNRIEDVTVYTLLDRQPVLPGTAVASVKVTPIAMPESRVRVVEQICRSASNPLLTVLPFQPRRVAVVAVEELTADQRARFQAAIERKLRWYGSELIDLRYVTPDAGQVAEAFDAGLRAGATLLLAAGGNTIDPLDPVERALALIGANIIHRGAPTRGSMFWLAQLDDVPIVNLASCRMYTGNTVADLVLPLLLTSRQVTPDDIIEIGYGGLLGSEMAFRFPPYDAESSE